MRPAFFARAFAFALIVAGTSILAAPSQTAQPGQMTQAKVWIQNHGRTEAVPVELRDVNLDAPLRVQVINGQPQFPSASPVQVRESRKVWEYETISVAQNDDVAAVLNDRGANGWETTGIILPGPNGMALLLKRPR